MSDPKFELELSPTYTLSHELEGSAELFWVAKALADTVLSDDFNILEKQNQYAGITVDNNMTTPAMSRAIRDTKFSDMAVVRSSSFNGGQVQIYLRDKDRPDRTINLVEMPSRPQHSKTFNLNDSYSGQMQDFPMVVPATAISLEASNVQEWLELQLLGADMASSASFSLEELCDLLGSRAQVLKREVKIGALALSTGAVLHAEHEATYDATDPSGIPSRNIYSTWITGAFESDAFNTENFEPATDVTARNIARFDGNNVQNASNTFAYEISAEFAADPMVITQLGLHAKEIQEQGVERFINAYNQLGLS